MVNSANLQRRDEVIRLSPFDRLAYFIQEREKIRLAKESGLKPPWTDDFILQSYRFTNVRRMDDAVSRWLMENWYVPNFDHPNMLLAVALARFINKPETLAVIGFPTQFNPARIIRKLREYRDGGGTVFNAAYMVRGGLPNDSQDKIEAVVSCYVDPLRVVEDKIDGSSMEDAWSEILPSYGMGSFMAGQIVADLRWAREGHWADRLTWAPMGPGSKRGMNRVLGQPINQAINQATFQTHLRKLMADLTLALPISIESRLEAIDFQNCLCEIGKYEKALWGEGRPKQCYPGKAATNG